MAARCASGQERVCPTCGGDVVGHANRIYCDDNCLKAAHKERYGAEYQREKNSRFRNGNPEKYRTMHYKSRYGITHEDAVSILDFQGGVCAICLCDIGFFRGRAMNCANIDHCHETGMVRGILCRRCNLMLGKAEDDEDLLIAAAEYLSCLK